MLLKWFKTFKLLKSLILHPFTLKKLAQMKPPKKLGAKITAALQIQNFLRTLGQKDKNFCDLTKYFFHLTTIYTPVDRLQ